MKYDEREIKHYLEDYFNEFIPIEFYTEDPKNEILIGEIKKGLPLRKFFEKYNKIKREDLPKNTLKKIKSLDNIIDELNIIFPNDKLNKDINRIRKLCEKAQKTIH